MSKFVILNLTNFSSTGWDQLILDGFEEYSNRLGFETIVFKGDTQNKTQMSEIFDFVENLKEDDIVISVNHGLDFLSLQHQNQLITPHLKCKVIRYFVDHPVHRYLEMYTLINNNDFLRDLFEIWDAPQKYNIYADEAWLQFINKSRPEFKYTAFLPMLHKPRKEKKQNISKEIDIVFIGNLSDSQKMAEKAYEITTGRPQLLKLFAQSLQSMIAKRGQMDVSQALDYFSGGPLGEYSEQYANRMMAFVDQSARSMFRTEVLQAFEKHEIHIIGDVNIPSLRQKSNLNFLGKKSIQQSYDLLKKSKFIIGDLAGFSHGIELRPSMAIANRACYFGERNVFMKKHFSDQSGYYPDHPSQYEATLADALSTPDQWHDRLICFEEEQEQLFEKNTIRFSKILKDFKITH